MVLVNRQRGMTCAALFLGCVLQIHAGEPAPPDPAAMVERIQKEVAELRGLPFKQSVPMEKQTREGLARHMDSEMAEMVPEAIEKHFDKIVRRVGLYRGPVLGDFRQLMKSVMTTQAAAYYDPDTKRFYVLAEGGSELEQGVIYSHELYHALQDQYFDLNSFMSKKVKLNSDQSLARTAVVEGEATYLHTMWAMRQIMRSTPQRAMLGPAIQAQAALKIDDLRSMMGESAQQKTETDSIPPFILETLIGNYMKGAAFIYAVQEQGWPAVEKIYREYPPQSTEQILHPAKWVARENPSAISWQKFRKERALKNWELLDDDVIGEIQWRVIFSVQGLAADAEAAAAGWDGDRYAVFKRKGADDTLMLLRTSWDSEAEATQFADAYRRLLPLKYADAKELARVEQQGVDVFIVEGGSQKDDIDALMKFVRQSKKVRG